MAAIRNTQAFYNTEIPSDWEIVKVLDFGKVYTGNTPLTSEPDNYDGEYLFVSPGDLSDVKYIDKTEKTLSEKGFSTSRKFPKGSVLFTCIGSTIGKSGIASVDLTANQQINAIVVNNMNSNEYLYYQLEINVNRIKLIAGEQAVPIINKSQFETIKLPKAPLPEQRAIAQVLSTADAAIHTTEKLIAQKELRKKWLMQQLLTGKKRLRGFENTKWKIQPLENFIKPIVREVPKPDVPYLGIGLRSHGKGTFLKHDEQPEKNSMDKFYVVRPNDLIVNITFAWEQSIAIVRPEDDGALASHRFPTYTFIVEKGHADFFRFYILQPRMKFMLEMISPGGAGRNRVMSKSDFIKLEFLLPEYKEQTAIAQVLQAADKEISLLKAKAEKLRELKKGLMQVLLTGKKRMIF